MLTTLRIQNMALIPAVEINFGPAFNVLTGETGAGKSIIIGSLNFIFGDKLSTNVIRSGTDFARVTAVFDETIITRTLYATGRSEIRVNDEPMTLKGLRQVAGTLVDIHGQHDSERLLDPKQHLAMLDQFGAVDLSAYQQAYAQLQEYQKQLASYGDNESDRARLLDLYQYQINEIKQAQLSAEEEDELNAKVVMLRHAEKLREGAVEIDQQLTAADGALGHAGKRLTGLVAFDGQLEKIAARLDAAALEVGDLLLEIRDYQDRVAESADSLESVEDRLEVIKNLKRKYGATVAAVLAFLDKTEQEQQRLLTAGDEIARLQQLLAQQQGVVQQAASQLRAARQAAAEKLQQQLVGQLADLGMAHAQFVVQFAEVAPRSSGADEVEFYFSANLGEAPRPLAQIISGGEMSRLMLALKTVTNLDAGKTLVFDEIDTGLSGNMGLALADKITALAQKSQVIVVTHLAALAAAADRHFLIAKNVTENKTVTNVYPLTEAARVSEIARIIGGGATAVAHATALLQRRQPTTK